MKVKTSELTVSALDWAVAKADENLYPSGGVRLIEGGVITISAGGHEEEDHWHRYSPSTDWSLAGPIIERELIGVTTFGDYWQAVIFNGSGMVLHKQYGPTPLVAAMRCLVASKMGDEVELPKELA